MFPVLLQLNRLNVWRQIPVMSNSHDVYKSQSPNKTYSFVSIYYYMFTNDLIL